MQRNAIHPAAADSPALAEFTLLKAWLASTPAAQLPLHSIESEQHVRGREVQRLLLQAHLEQRGVTTSRTNSDWLPSRIAIVTIRVLL